MFCNDPALASATQGRPGVASRSLASNRQSALPTGKYTPAGPPVAIATPGGLEAAVVVATAGASALRKAKAKLAKVA